MNKLSVALLIAFIFLAGCKNKEEVKSSTSSLTSSQPAVIVNPAISSQPTTTSEDKF